MLTTLNITQSSSSLALPINSTLSESAKELIRLVSRLLLDWMALKTEALRAFETLGTTRPNTDSHNSNWAFKQIYSQTCYNSERKMCRPYVESALYFKQIIIIIIITNYSVFFLTLFYDAQSIADITWRLKRNWECQPLHKQLQYSAWEGRVNLYSFKANNSVKILYDMYLQYKVRQKYGPCWSHSQIQFKSHNKFPYWPR